MSRPVLFAALAVCLLYCVGTSFGAQEVMILPGDTGSTQSTAPDPASSSTRMTPALMQMEISLLPNGWLRDALPSCEKYRLDFSLPCITANTPENTARPEAGRKRKQSQKKKSK